MKKIHIAVGVLDIPSSVKDYSHRLGCLPVVVIPNEYALWRTATINFSIRRDSKTPGMLRHLGWEDLSVSEFTQEKDINGITWERFNAEHQAKEIKDTWPQSNYVPNNEKKE